MSRKRTTRLGLAAGALAMILGAGCSPYSITFTFGERPEKLEESVVLSDPGTPAQKIALIDLTGVIADAPTPGLLGAGPNPVDELLVRFAHAEADPAVRAVVLRVNSPGGSVTASDILYHEIVRFREESGKPVVAYFGEIAASGGYYVSLAADEIVAQPTSITASIGVIVPTVNVSQGLARIGIVARSVTSGPNKDMANPLEPMRDSQYAIIQGMVNEYYARFRTLVVERRPGLSPGNLDEATDGRVMSGEQALELGLVDSTGSVRDAFTEAKQLAGVPSARLVKYYDRGPAPRTPYAATGGRVVPEAGWGGPSGESEINLMQLNIGQATLGQGAPMAWYLWTGPM